MFLRGYVLPKMSQARKTLLWGCVLSALVAVAAKVVGYSDLESLDGTKLSTYFRGNPSVKSWNTVDIPRRFAITSMVVDHSSYGNWLMPSLHQKHSSGWNRTHQSHSSNNPIACNVRFFGTGLESTLEGFQLGGTGYLTLGYASNTKREFWHGFDKNETNKLHCYYKTNKDTGSEFIDTPKNLGLAITCPISMDMETGPFLHNRNMEQGYFCRPLAEFPAEVAVHLRPSSFQVDLEPASDEVLAARAAQVAAQEISAEIRTNPAEVRQMEYKALAVVDYRPHAVCTVQTFRNAQTGAMLYMFISYYQLMGWRVIVYDRFGLHQKDVQSLLKLPGVDYYPFTQYQLTQPTKYNKEFVAKQGSDYKSFYKMEVNWGYSSKKLADTADQDADKSRTYDYARLEYSHLDMILYIDADELFFCPQASDSVANQRAFQHRTMSQFSSRGVEEMRFVRIPYSGMAIPGYVNSAENRSNVDFTNHTGNCMNAALQKKSLGDMSRCWSGATSYDNFPKSADFASVCPFHYNHWSCDGMKGGGRDWTKNRCRCKVSFEMQNGFEYKPVLKRCHLMHFNDNKYRFQSKRTKHVYDKGEVTQLSPLAKLLGAK